MMINYSQQLAVQNNDLMPLKICVTSALTSFKANRKQGSQAYGDLTYRCQEQKKGQCYKGYLLCQMQVLWYIVDCGIKVVLYNK